MRLFLKSLGILETKSKDVDHVTSTPPLEVSFLLARHPDVSEIDTKVFFCKFNVVGLKACKGSIKI